MSEPARREERLSAGRQQSAAAAHHAKSPRRTEAASPWPQPAPSSPAACRHVLIRPLAVPARVAVAQRQVQLRGQGRWAARLAGRRGRSGTATGAATLCSIRSWHMRMRASAICARTHLVQRREGAAGLGVAAQRAVAIVVIAQHRVPGHLRWGGEESKRERAAEPQGMHANTSQHAPASTQLHGLPASGQEQNPATGHPPAARAPCTRL